MSSSYEDLNELALAAASARVVSYHCDVKSGQVRRSGNSLRLIGLPSQGPTEAWSDLISPEDRPHFENALRSVSPLHAGFEVEYRIAHALNGHHIWVLDRGQAVFSPAGDRLYVQGAIVDISAQIGTELALRQSVHMNAVAFEAARIATWHLDMATGILTCTDELLALLGTDRTSFTGSSMALEKFIHAEDTEIWRSFYRMATSRSDRQEVEFRIVRPNAEVRWMLARGEINRRKDGTVREAYGIVMDITERKAWDVRQSMLLRELSHRVKNTLAVIQSMTRQTLHSNSDPEKFVEAFEGRIRSLAASHNLLTDVDWKGARLVDILRSQLEGMVDSLGARFTFRGPDVMVSTGVATQLGLVIHELGTNASKYGALSTNDGHIDVVWTVYGNKLRLSWRERGGPAVTGDTKYEGFGTALFRSTSSKVTRRFLRKGFSCRLEIAL